MVHQQEYRLYWLLWGMVPLLLATGVFLSPALRQAPRIDLVITDSLPDHLYRVDEAITFGFKAEALDRDQFQALWLFGDSVQALQHAPADSSASRLQARLDWQGSDSSATGLKLALAYDTLPPPLRKTWQTVATLADSAVRVKFRHPGRYKFKLVLQDTLRKRVYAAESELEVVEARAEFPTDTAVKIVGPSTGLVGEDLVFSAKGSKVRFWYWKFGDKENYDSNQRQVVYSYSEEGKYTVTLKTDNPDRYLYHTVEIFPTWNADSIAADTLGPPEDPTERYQREIKSWLQEIANTSTSATNRFYQLKGIIKQSYLSERVKTVYVWVNDDEEPVDFDSYCQRIHFLEGDLVIEKVAFDWAGDSSQHRVSALRVQQRNVRE